MVDQQKSDNREDLLRRVIGYFDRSVLASYKDAPEKYILETDNFEGQVRTTESYYRQLETAGDMSDYIDVRFGYRTLSNGQIAVAAFLPDLLRKSEGHVNRWAGFALKDPQWITGPDERYDSWVSRYIEGSWEVENGVRARLEGSVRAISGLTNEAVGKPLFKFADTPAPNFPSAENTHSYQDAHERLYGYIIDGLDKECIVRIAAHQGITINVSSDKTKAALAKALPTFPPGSALWVALEEISKHRRVAGHAVRDAAENFPAFKTFNDDMENCLSGLIELQAHLEGVLGMSSERASKRQSAKKYLPEIVRPAESHYAISRLPVVVGKTIERVEFGFRREAEGAHQSEAIILYFTDGSIIGIDTGSNICNLASEHEGLKPEDLHVDLNLQWVPPPN